MMNKHTFHIPVMGTGFTIETPLKVAHLGIDSAISLVDDILIENMRQAICKTQGIVYKRILDSVDDYRAKRITAYLNLLQQLTAKKFDALKKDISKNIESLLSYCSMFSNNDPNVLKELPHLFDDNSSERLKEWVDENTHLGSIDVNIMTKIDRDHYKDGKQLPHICNDAHSALRGFANSKLTSSLIFSAGMNPRLFTYIQEFDDFFPDENGYIKKWIILKVSDFRSAFIQGKFLAKKGVFVSEFRVESGLNCGGHAFATDGYLLGPILEEFKEKKQVLIDELNKIVKNALAQKGRTVPTKPLHIRFTAQGGVGTGKEHQFLLDHYQLDAIGWATPFLLVPEVTSVDEKTMAQLSDASENDVYLSDISPLGISFNSLRGNTKDIEKQKNIDKGRPGSPCPSKFIELNKEFGETGLCISSRKYQYLKIKELDEKNLDKEIYDKEYAKIVEKSCICLGLGISAMLVNGIDTKKVGDGVSICPGPNIAYFNKITGLRTMIGHIYGYENVINIKNRPNMFVKELGLYIDYFKTKTSENLDEAKKKFFQKFAHNLEEGIKYYQEINSDLSDALLESKKLLSNLKERLN